MQVVGFAGPARVGKSSTTEALKLEATSKGWEVIVLPFAGPLKREAERQGFGKKTDPAGYRKFCQEHGAEMRAQDSSHWLNLWIEDLKDVRQGHFNNDKSEKPLLIIVDDVRYENELEMIDGSGGYTFFLTPGERELPEAAAEWRTHESEMMANTLIGNPKLAEQTFDYVVRNDGPVEDITRWSKAVVKSLISWPGDKDSVCDCEGCIASLENRPVNQDKINKELEDLLDELEGDDDDD
jgi:hypothetical protein